MKCTLLIPVRSFADAKSRLGPILTSEERNIAMKSFVENVIDAGKATDDISEIVLISDDEDVATFALENDVNYYSSGEALNPSLARCIQSRATSDAIIISHGDLAVVDDFADICNYIEIFDVVMAPDRHRTGTNVLAHRTECAFEYMFGENSLAQHTRQCLTRRLSRVIVQSRNYSFDIDTPEDFSILKKMNS